MYLDFYALYLDSLCNALLMSYAIQLGSCYAPCSVWVGLGVILLLPITNSHAANVQRNQSDVILS